MAERDLFDERLVTAVRAFADEARTQVDALQVAERAIGAGRRRSFSWPRALAAPVWLLLLVGLLLAAFAWGLVIGGAGRNRSQVAVPPTASPTVAAAPSPTASLDPGRSAHVSGSPYVSLMSPGVSSQTGGETRVSGLVYDLQEDVDDPRVAGFGTLTLDTSGTATMSYGSGQVQIDGADGTWDGTCTSASWNAGRTIALSCWLTGSGAYEGLTYYRYSLTSDAGGAFEGVIMPAPPPSP